MIKFPGFGLQYNVNLIAFKIYGINIYYYAICIVLGMIAALFVCKISRQKFGIKFDDCLDCFIFAIIFGIIGARIYYCLFHFNYYFANPMKIISLRDGGLAIYGGLIGGAIAIISRCKRLKVSVIDLFDYIAPSVALAQSIGRWGNFFNQEAYGTKTSNLFRMGIYTLDGYTEVHPTFLYESISTFLIFILLINLQKRRKFRGQIFYLYLLLYSAIRMFIEGLRIDSLMLGNFRISQILSVAIFVVSGIILLKKYGKYIYNEKWW